MSLKQNWFGSSLWSIRRSVSGTEYVEYEALRRNANLFGLFCSVKPLNSESHFVEPNWHRTFIPSHPISYRKHSCKLLTIKVVFAELSYSLLRRRAIDLSKLTFRTPRWRKIFLSLQFAKHRIQYGNETFAGDLNSRSMLHLLSPAQVCFRELHSRARVSKYYPSYYQEQ